MVRLIWYCFFISFDISHVWHEVLVFFNHGKERRLQKGWLWDGSFSSPSWAMEGKARGRSCGFLKGKFYRKNLSATHDFIFYQQGMSWWNGSCSPGKGTKGRQGGPSVGGVEACHLLQAIVEQAMAWWWLYYNQELFSLGSKWFIFHIVLYVLSILSRVQKILITVWCSLLQSVASPAGFAVDFTGSRYQWREYYPICFSGPHYAACGRRRMSSSARHKQRFVLPG